MKNLVLSVLLIVFVFPVIAQINTQKTIQLNSKGEKSIPVLTTAEITDVNINSTLTGGAITSNGGSLITNKGVCWSTSSSPTISGYHTSDGDGQIDFISRIQELNENTIYYIRAYAVNTSGVGYGNELSFKTYEYGLNKLFYWGKSNKSNLNGEDIKNLQNSGMKQTIEGVLSMPSSDTPEYIYCCYPDYYPEIKKISLGMFIIPLELNYPFYRNDNTTPSTDQEISLDLIPVTDANNKTSLYRVYRSYNKTAGDIDAEITEVIEGAIPIVIFDSVSNIASTTIDAIGNVRSNGKHIATKGFCWNTIGSPTFADDHTFAPYGSGSFVSSINGLIPNTTYFIRAYAGNNEGIAYSTEKVVLTYFGVLTWTGTVSSSWDDVDNWDGGVVPNRDYNVIIADAGTSPIIISGIGADCNNLTINSGAMLTVESGGSLITEGMITNNGIFNAERSISNEQWHMISSPITNAQSGMFVGDYLQEWNETTGLWSDISSITTPLTPVKGFGFWSNGTGSTTHTFTGTPNTGGQSLSLSTSGSGGSYDDANLLGNPYPSSIDWALLDGIENGAVYCYNGTGYLNWNNGSGTGSQYIAPMQGFFIIAPSAGTFNVDNSYRVHNGATNYYKSTNTVSNGLVLAASNGIYEDELWIAFNETANAEFDYEYDAYKFFSGNSGIAQLYTITEGNILSIDIRPETGEIQLGFKNDQDGVYQIGISQIDGISSAILEDTKHEIFHDLKMSDYDFSWEISDNETRFKLYLNVAGINEILTTTQIFAYQKTINIRSIEPLNNAEIQILDMIGKIVYKKRLVNGQNETITTPVKDGVYLIQLISDNGTQVEKVILK